MEKNNAYADKSPAMEKNPTFWGDTANRSLMVMALVANLVAWLLVLIRLAAFPEPVILHYNAYFGVDWDGETRWALLLPGAGLLVCALNLALSFYFVKKDFLVTRIFTGGALLFNLMVNAAVAALIFVNQV